MSLGNRFSQASASQVPDIRKPRSTFNRSFTAKDTMMFDALTPFFIDEVIPGDTFNLNVNVFARLATQVAPLMDNIYLDYFFFYVPNRLVWDNWEKFCGFQENPGDTTDFLIPTVEVLPVEPFGGLASHFGLPVGNLVSAKSVNALPFRCYNLIWNTWFRDQNLQDSIDVPKDDGPDVMTTYPLQARGRRHDYFNAGLPSPQKGPAIEIPLQTSSAAVVRDSNAPFWLARVAGSDTLAATGDVATTVSSRLSISGSGQDISLDPNGGLSAVLSPGVMGTIEMLREAWAIQSFLELNNRTGTRYVEYLFGHFGVVSPDFRLQRPEFLSMSTITINSHPVAQTSPTSGSNPMAQLASFATASSQGSHVGFTKSFQEHGYVIGLCCARGEISYQQMLHKMWQRSTLYDFYDPAFANLGDQPVLNSELYCDGSANDEGVFNYVERWAEYRFRPSEIRGIFRSSATGSLDFWHVAQEFDSVPSFNAEYIKQATPIERNLAVADSTQVLLDYWFQYTCARIMPVHSTPSSLARL